MEVLFCESATTLLPCRQRVTTACYMARNAFARLALNKHQAIVSGPKHHL